MQVTDYDPTVLPPGLPLILPISGYIVKVPNQLASVILQRTSPMAPIQQNPKRISILKRLSFPERLGTLMEKPTEEFCEPEKSEVEVSPQKIKSTSFEPKLENKNGPTTSDPTEQRTACWTSEDGKHRQNSSFNQHQSYQPSPPIEDTRHDNFKLWNHFCRGRPLSMSGRRGTSLEILRDDEVDQLFKYRVIEGEISLHEIRKRNEQRRLNGTTKLHQLV